VAKKLPEVPTLDKKVAGKVTLVWRESANVGGSTDEIRAVYSSFEDAMSQAYGDRRPGRLEVCPTCGTHVAGIPSGHGLIELGYTVLRVEDSKGNTIWEPKGKSRAG